MYIHKILYHIDNILYYIHSEAVFNMIGSYNWDMTEAYRLSKQCPDSLLLYFNYNYISNNAYIA